MNSRPLEGEGKIGSEPSNSDLAQGSETCATRPLGSISDHDLDRPRELMVVKWEGRLHCVYLDDHRIAGGKPWGGGDAAKTWNVTLREVIRVFPELQKLAGLNYLGDRLPGCVAQPTDQPGKSEIDGADTNPSPQRGQE